MHTIAFIDLVGAVLTAFIAVRIVAQPSENRLASITFSGFLGCCVLFLLEDAYLREDWFEVVPWFDSFSSVAICIGPCFFLYARAVTQRGFAWRWPMIGHFAFPLLVLALFVVSLLTPAEIRIATIRESKFNVEHGTRPTFELVILAIFDAFHITYLSLAWWTLWTGRTRLAEEREEGRSHPMPGIGLFATAVLVIAVLATMLDFSKWAASGDGITAMAIVLIVFALLWWTTQPHPFLIGKPPHANHAFWEAAAIPGEQSNGSTAVATIAEAEPANNPAVSAEISGAPSATVAGPTVPIEEVNPEEVIRPSGLKPEEVARIGARVKALLEKEKLHLDPELTLQTLAEKAKTTRHKVSAVLKAGFGASFYQLISSYRVREAARLLRNKEAARQTIAEIAFASGFNTLSAFNAAFRAHFQVTPRQYRDQVETPDHEGKSKAG